MNERERDRALLSTLAPGDRAECEGLVDLFIRSEMQVITPEALLRAAVYYEDAGRSKPCSDGMTGLLFAAILRERAAALLG